jgi:hypothetical protein
MKAIATVAAVVVLMALTPVHADRRPSPTLTVRLYNTAGIPTTHLLAARRSAAGILEDAGVVVAFRHCGTPVPGEPVDPCHESLTAAEVVVRIINAPAFNLSVSRETYGVTYVVEQTNRGWLATVFADRTTEAAVRAGVEPGTVLGRVLAHEVGHLLLGVGYHGDAGLMRATWSDSLLGRGGDEWKFSLNEATRLQRALTAVARLPVAASPTS